MTISAVEGGGFFNYGTAGTMTNDTFAQDVGNPGGGIFTAQTLSIANSVFSDASCSSLE